MKQIRYALQDLWRHKGTSIILLFQTILLLGIVNFIVWSLHDAHDMKREIQRLNESKEIYGLMDFTSRMHEEQLSQNEKSSIPRLRKLYDSIYENDKVKAFSLYQSNIQFEKDKFGDSRFVNTLENNVFIPFVQTNNLFFDYFNIEVAEGRTFNEQEYTQPFDEIPVLIGHDLTFKFKLGDTFQAVGAGRYKVIGVLKENSSYIDIMASREFQDLDRMIVLPLNKSEFVSVSDYTTAIGRAYMTADDPAALQEILQRAAGSDTLSFALKSMSNQAKVVAQDKEKMLQIQLLLSSLILIFAFVTVTVSYLQFIEKHIYEFGVHILSGATRTHLAIRLGGQFLILLIVSNLIALKLLGRFADVPVSMTTSVLLIALFLTIPIIRLSRMPMTSMLRGRSR
ncbi:hypothetical protein B9G55_11850 [Saccharibacillus sp. O16]|nr:hypothetical protein B9G55_11850 [Saccharibacillus sp. O16]